MPEGHRFAGDDGDGCGQTEFPALLIHVGEIVSEWSAAHPSKDRFAMQSGEVDQI
jgi:hypothetical protein